MKKEKNTKEKKVSEKQKIALERIYRLFELAEKQKDEKLVKRYLKLAKKIGEKTNVSIPKTLKKKFCKKCFTMNVKTIEKKPFLLVICGKCGFEKKFSLKEKKQ